MSLSRTVIAGLVLAVVAALAVTFGDAFGLDLAGTAAVGLACGAALGLARPGNPLVKIGGFLIGFALMWLGFGIQAQFLPDSPAGVAVGLFIVFALCAGICAATLGRLPLWTFFVGVAAIAGAYQLAFTQNTPDFLSESPVIATSVLVNVALGFAATVIFASFDEEDGADSELGQLMTGGSPRHSTSLDDLMTSKDGH